MSVRIGPAVTLEIPDIAWRRTNKSKRLCVDLSVAHEDHPLGLKATGITYLWLTVEKADSPFTFKLNERTGDPFTGAVGASLEQHEFTEVYVTNEAGTGEAIIQVGWRG
jgi:hypothetical protein